MHLFSFSSVHQSYSNIYTGKIQTQGFLHISETFLHLQNLQHFIADFL